MYIRTLIGIAAAIALIIGVVLILTLVGGINLIDYFTQVAVGLTLLIFGLIYWTFKPYIDRYIDSKIYLSISVPRRNNSFTEIPTPKIDNIQQDTSLPLI